MADRFAPKEAIGLYSVVLGGSLVFFVLGVYVGKQFRSPSFLPPDPIAAETGGETPELELYETLVPQDPATAPETQAEEATPIDSKPDQESAPPEPRTEPATTPARPDRAPARSDPPAAASPDTRQPTPLPASYFTVQVAALASREEASQIVLRLEANDYPSQVVQPELGNRFFRVWVGEAMTRAEADRLAARLRGDGFHTYVKPVRRKPAN